MDLNRKLKCPIVKIPLKSTAFILCNCLKSIKINEKEAGNGPFKRKFNVESFNCNSYQNVWINRYGRTWKREIMIIVILIQEKYKYSTNTKSLIMIMNYLIA